MNYLVPVINILLIKIIAFRAFLDSGLFRQPHFFCLLKHILTKKLNGYICDPNYKIDLK
jgi:hypothetical protein